MRRGAHTEWCKSIPACLNFRVLANASLSNQPQASKSAIFGKIGRKTINLAGLFLHNGVLAVALTQTWNCGSSLLANDKLDDESADTRYSTQMNLWDVTGAGKFEGSFGDHFGPQKGCETIILVRCIKHEVDMTFDAPKITSTLSFANFHTVPTMKEDR